MIEAADIAAKLDQSLRGLSADKSALRAAEASAEEIADVDALISDVTDARNVIIAKSLQRQEKRERVKKHAAILPQCVRLREEFEAAGRAVESANQAYLVANSALENAQLRLNDHVANPIPQDTYPSAKRIREWNLRRDQLETAVEKSRLEVRARNVERDQIQSQYMHVTREFERVSFQERMLRPPEESPKVVPTAWRSIEGPELTGVR